ncbi:MAG: hypothetical protein ACRDQ4_22800 [Pseudonocardiaceae bacterium]
MAPRTPRPRPTENPGHDTESTLPRPLSEFPLLDAEGTRMSLGNRVEQVVVEEAHGALRSRLHQHGEIIGRDHKMITARQGTRVPPAIRGWQAARSADYRRFHR